MNAADEVLLGFAEALRVAGVPVTPDRGQAFCRAVSLAGMRRAEGRVLVRPGDPVRRAGTTSTATTVCSTPGSAPSDGPAACGRTPRRGRLPGPTSAAAREHGDGDRDRVRPDGRQRDRGAAAPRRGRPGRGRAPAAGPDDGRTGRAHRRRAPAHGCAPYRRGRIDAGRTMRDQLRRGGEPGPLQFRRRGRTGPPGRAAGRRVRVDGAVRRPPAAARPPDGAGRAGDHRGADDGNPTHPGHGCHAAPRRRLRALRAARSDRARLVRRHAAR